MSRLMAKSICSVCYAGPGTPSTEACGPTPSASVSSPWSRQHSSGYPSSMPIVEPHRQSSFQSMHTCYDAAVSQDVWFIVQVLM